MATWRRRGTRGSDKRGLGRAHDIEMSGSGIARYESQWQSDCQADETPHETTVTKRLASVKLGLRAQSPQR
jgi:hypothetical protein